MRVLQITPAYKPAYVYGGPTMSVAKLAETLVQAGIPTQVLTTTANGRSELPFFNGENIILDGVKVQFFSRWTKDHSHFSPSLLRALYTLIRKDSNEQELVIHIHAWWNLVSILSCCLARVKQVQIILSPRGMLTEYTLSNKHNFLKRIFHHAIGQRLLRSCHIHATSEQEKKDILKHIIPLSVTVISNLVEVQKGQVRTIKERKERTFRLLFLSRLEQKKGLEFLLMTLKNCELPWELTIAGDGEPSYVEKLRKISSDRNDVHWKGQVNNNDKYDLLAEHDLLILPSYNENFANVVIESLSVGTAVMVSEEVGLAEYVRTNDLGWVSPMEQSEFLRQITNAYQDISKRKSIRRNGPDLIAKDFNDHILIQRYLNLYHRVRGLKELSDLT